MAGGVLYENVTDDPFATVCVDVVSDEAPACPQASYRKRRLPITPAETSPVAIPMRI